jgi:hypothetical protein
MTFRLSKCAKPMLFEGQVRVLAVEFVLPENVAKGRSCG